MYLLPPIDVGHGTYLWTYMKVICEVAISFTPYPLFQWYPQSKEILLNLNMKWNAETQHLMNV
jgi:hypothetical protein